MQPAARIGDGHECPKIEPGPVPHLGGEVSSGSKNVYINDVPAARVGDEAKCVPCNDQISTGSMNVLVNDRQATCRGELTKHGGKNLSGSPNVLIGEGGGDGTYQGGFRVVDEKGTPVRGCGYEMRTAEGITVRGFTDEDGHTVVLRTSRFQSSLKQRRSRV
jgi:uncharacterized Zn-binding protein involved in type VI secretion